MITATVPLLAALGSAATDARNWSLSVNVFTWNSPPIVPRSGMSSTAGVSSLLISNVADWSCAVVGLNSTGTSIDFPGASETGMVGFVSENTLLVSPTIAMSEIVMFFVALGITAMFTEICAVVFGALARS